ncbi:MAG: hypothetical protein RLY86_1245 [Pseudomonadota bacterium]|jgi:8-oxo-dGTP pyrophosphatase MutT (NUDIX family)
MTKKTAPFEGFRAQYAALPYRMVDGFPQILLVTSRDTRRWVLPKGWPEKRRTPWDMAAREAREEAGLVGRVDHRPVGCYHYEKHLDAGTSVPCEVTVFPLAVDHQLDDWREKDQRSARWFTPGQAALAVQEGGLARILLAFGACHKRAHAG